MADRQHCWNTTTAWKQGTTFLLNSGETRIYANISPAKYLSAKEKREIVATWGTDEAIASIRERFGIGTTRLYRIWQEAGQMDPKHSAPEQEEHQEKSQEEHQEEEDPFFELLDTFAKTCMQYPNT